MRQKFEYFETNIGKIIYFGLLAVVPALIIILFVYDVVWGPSFNQVMTKEYSSETVHGVVDSLFDDVPNHDIRTAILTNKIIYQIESSWINDIEVGDSLSKDTGSFLLNVYKKNGKKVVLDYKPLIPTK